MFEKKSINIKIPFYEKQFNMCTMLENHFTFIHKNDLIESMVIYYVYFKIIFCEQFVNINILIYLLY